MSSKAEPRIMRSHRVNLLMKTSNMIDDPDASLETNVPDVPFKNR